MPRMTARERREAYQREYQFQKKTGKPFFPYAVLHDTITSLVVVALIMGLTILWHSGFGPAPTEAGGERPGGFLGPAYEAQADPGTASYDPRPEWYFFFLFQLLRIFSTPELLLFGTIIVPTMLMVLMLAWPFLDRGPERRVSRRPVSMALAIGTPIVLLALTWSGSQAPAVGGAASGHAGAALFADTGLGCASCHTLKDAGASGTVGPVLDTLNPDYKTALDFITNGKAGTAMQSYKAKGATADQIACVASYVAAWANGGAKAASVDQAKYAAACKAAGADGTTK